jgi:hypothetical protein
LEKGMDQPHPIAHHPKSPKRVKGSIRATNEERSPR